MLRIFSFIDCTLAAYSTATNNIRRIIPTSFGNNFKPTYWNTDKENNKIIYDSFIELEKYSEHVFTEETQFIVDCFIRKFYKNMVPESNEIAISNRAMRGLQSSISSLKEYLTEEEKKTSPVDSSLLYKIDFLLSIINSYKKCLDIKNNEKNDSVYINCFFRFIYSRLISLSREQLTKDVPHIAAGSEWLGGNSDNDGIMYQKRERLLTFLRFDSLEYRSPRFICEVIAEIADYNLSSYNYDERIDEMSLILNSCFAISKFIASKDTSLTTITMRSLNKDITTIILYSLKALSEYDPINYSIAFLRCLSPKNLQVFPIISKALKICFNDFNFFDFDYKNYSLFALLEFIDSMIKNGENNILNSNKSPILTENQERIMQILNDFVDYIVNSRARNALELPDEFLDLSSQFISDPNSPNFKDIKHEDYFTDDQIQDLLLFNIIERKPETCDTGIEGTDHIDINNENNSLSEDNSYHSKLKESNRLDNIEENSQSEQDDSDPLAMYLQRNDDSHINSEEDSKRTKIDHSNPLAMYLQPNDDSHIDSEEGNKMIKISDDKLYFFNTRSNAPNDRYGKGNRNTNHFYDEDEDIFSTMPKIPNNRYGKGNHKPNHFYDEDEDNSGLYSPIKNQENLEKDFIHIESSDSSRFEKYLVDESEIRDPFEQLNLLDDSKDFSASKQKLNPEDEDSCLKNDLTLDDIEQPDFVDPADIPSPSIRKNNDGSALSYLYPEDEALSTVDDVSGDNSEEDGNTLLYLYPRNKSLTTVEEVSGESCSSLDVFDRNLFEDLPSEAQNSFYLRSDKLGNHYSLQVDYDLNSDSRSTDSLSGKNLSEAPGDESSMTDIVDSDEHINLPRECNKINQRNKNFNDFDLEFEEISHSELNLSQSQNNSTKSRDDNLPNNPDSSPGLFGSVFGFISRWFSSYVHFLSY